MDIVQLVLALDIYSVGFFKDCIETIGRDKISISCEICDVEYLKDYHERKYPGYEKLCPKCFTYGVKEEDKYNYRIAYNNYNI
jgi:hypothetical protein